MTASQRVLQLQSENKALMEQRDAMIAENKRLNAIIAENQKLLGQADTAIAASVKQLELANRNNQILKQRIVTLQSENESQMAESKRMLDSIRQRLDDVLIREISSK
jgi:DNA repair exonuclease SbcCD ATPase subunit